jgi:hypothetical protein
MKRYCVFTRKDSSPIFGKKNKILQRVYYKNILLIILAYSFYKKKIVFTKILRN